MQRLYQRFRFGASSLAHHFDKQEVKTSMSEKKPLKLLKVRDAAEVLGISESKMWDLKYSRDIPFVPIGRAVRFKMSDLEDFVEQQTERCGALR